VGLRAGGQRAPKPPKLTDLLLPTIAAYADTTVAIVGRSRSVSLCLRKTWRVRARKATRSWNCCTHLRLVSASLPRAHTHTPILHRPPAVCEQRALSLSTLAGSEGVDFAAFATAQLTRVRQQTTQRNWYALLGIVAEILSVFAGRAITDGGQHFCAVHTEPHSKARFQFAAEAATCTFSDRLKQAISLFLPELTGQSGLYKNLVKTVRFVVRAWLADDADHLAATELLWTSGLSSPSDIKVCGDTVLYTPASPSIHAGPGVDGGGCGHGGGGTSVSLSSAMRDQLAVVLAENARKAKDRVTALRRARAHKATQVRRGARLVASTDSLPPGAALFHPSAHRLPRTPPRPRLRQ
jgi:hypothetical protein